MPGSTPATKPQATIPWLTLLFIVIAAVVYGWQGWFVGHWGKFSSEDLLLLGGNLPPLTLGPQPWRLVTSLFLHASPFHLISNLIALFILGSALEILISRWKWLVLFLLGGLFASFVTACIHYDYVHTTIFGTRIHEWFVSVGLSGAIMSVTGAIIAVGLFQFMWQRADETSGRLLRGALVIAVLNIIYGFTQGDIDNAAHLSGLAFGFILGLGLLVPHQRVGRVLRLGALSASLLVVALSTSLIYAATLPAAKARGPLLQHARQVLFKVHHQRAVKLAKAREAQKEMHYVGADQASGVSIPLVNVEKLVPTQTSNIVYAATNGTASRIIKYNLKTAKPIGVVANVPYPSGKGWGCAQKNCFGIGISDLVINKAGTKAYASTLYPGSVSRIDLATGHIDYTTHVGTYPNRLLFKGGRLYTYDRLDGTLSVLDADSGKQLARVNIPGRHARTHEAYVWRSDRNPPLVADKKAVYLINPEHQVVRIDEHTLKPVRLDIRQVETLSTDAAGRVWIVAHDGVYAAGKSPERRYTFHYPQTLNRGVGRSHLAGADDDPPLILHAAFGKKILGISAITSDLRRVWPIDEAGYGFTAIKWLDATHIYLPGNRGTQILNIRRSQAPGKWAQMYASFQRIDKITRINNAYDDRLSHQKIYAPPPPPPPPPNH